MRFTPTSISSQQAQFDPLHAAKCLDLNEFKNITIPMKKTKAQKGLSKPHFVDLLQELFGKQKINSISTTPISPTMQQQHQTKVTKNAKNRPAKHTKIPKKRAKNSKSSAR